MTVRVDVFVDALCVWAWVSGIRIREVMQRFGDQVELDWHFLNLFGCTARRIGEGWAEKGGYEGFAGHVEQVCRGFEHVQPNPEIWRRVRPVSSMPAHLWLKAAQQQLAEKHRSAAMGAVLAAVQEAFFCHARDISRQAVLEACLAGQGLDITDLAARVASGDAAAEVARDLNLADQYRLRGSPSYVLNEGRQILFGNVGYRIIEANIQEILNRPGDIASWC